MLASPPDKGCGSDKHKGYGAHSLWIAAALSVPDNLKTNDQIERTSLSFFHLSTMSFPGKKKNSLPPYIFPVLLSPSFQGEKYSTVLCPPLCSSVTKCTVSLLYPRQDHTSPHLPYPHTTSPWTPCSVPVLKLLGFLPPVLPHRIPSL